MPTTTLSTTLKATADALKHGHVRMTDAGQKFSWGGSSLHPSLPESCGGQDCAEHVDAAQGVSPLDEHNVKLLDCVHPVLWFDPIPEEGFVYDLIALGAGAGGLVSAKQAARRGAKSALIEAHLAGGDCLTVGCVPSKALLRCARAAKEIRRRSDFGLDGDDVAAGYGPPLSLPNFGKVMERMRRLRAQIAPNDSHEATVAAGADVYQGRGVFVGPNAIKVNGKVLHFKKAVIATGGSAAVPPIPGLKDAPFHTNATLFNLTVLPPRVVVIGAGPIGLEMAQAFALFGAKVTCLLRSDKLLPKEDPEAAAIVRASLEADGVAFATSVAYDCVEHEPAAPGSAYPTISVKCTRDGAAVAFDCEVLLVATGRKPNVVGIGLDEAGVAFSRRTGVQVDDHLRTTNPDIYAVGDVCTQFQFTHVAGTSAGIVVNNALFGGADRFSSLAIPWATYTEPEVAHVGLYERDCADRGIAIDTYKTSLEHNDRAILEGSTEGFVKIHCRKGTDEILGATIVADHAGELISELTLALQHGIGLGKIGKTIHPYPTVSEGVAGCGFAYNRTQWRTMSSGPVETVKKHLHLLGVLALGVGLGAAFARR